jgi:hypothetical protein
LAPLHLYYNFDVAFERENQRFISIHDQFRIRDKRDLYIISDTIVQILAGSILLVADVANGIVVGSEQIGGNTPIRTVLAPICNVCCGSEAGWGDRRYGVNWQSESQVRIELML